MRNDCFNWKTFVSKEDFANSRAIVATSNWLQMFGKFEILVELCVTKMQQVGGEFLVQVDIVCKIIKRF